MDRQDQDADSPPKGPMARPSEASERLGQPGPRDLAEPDIPGDERTGEHRPGAGIASSGEGKRSAGDAERGPDSEQHS